MSAVIKCQGCGEYVSFKGWPQNHKCGFPTPKDVNFKTMSHRQVLDYFLDNPEEIERGLHDMLKEVSIFRGKVDLIGRDKNDCLCLIEVVHKSNYDRQSWIKKLQKHRSSLRSMEPIYKCKNLQMRILLKRPLHPVEDVTDTDARAADNNE